MHPQYTAAEALQQILEKSLNDEDIEDMNNDSDSEIDEVIANSIDIDSEDDEDLGQQIHIEASMMVSENGREQWSKLPLPENGIGYGRTQRRDVKPSSPLMRSEIYVAEVQAVFKLFLMHSIVQQIVDRVHVCR